MNNYSEKIVSIKETEKELLKIVKNKLEDENSLFNLNTKNIVDVISHDEKMIKKYEAVVKAQELIAKYTEMIKNSTSVEEIVEIRKELNKCISKVKKEMINRGFDDIEINNYCLDIKKYRKCVSESIRILKRENKIKEIESLNSNIDNLNEEDLLRLKKLIKNEISYGKRNINKYNVSDENTTIKDNKVKTTLGEELEKIYPKKEVQEKKTLKEELEEIFSKKETDNKVKTTLGEELEKIYPKKEVQEKKTLKEELEEIFSKKETDNKVKTTLGEELEKIYPKKEIIEKNDTLKEELGNIIKSSGTISYKQYSNLHDYIDEKVDTFNDRYHINNMESYSGNTIKNLKIFSKNLPIIMHNKGRIKYMIRDYNMFYRQAELVGFTEYTKKNNSIFGNIKKMIKGSSLSDKEEFYKKEHENCVNWIIEFCKDNNLHIRYNKIV